MENLSSAPFEFSVVVPNCLIHVPEFLKKEKADEFMQELIKECGSDFCEISGGGRSIARYGKEYTYRGRALRIRPWRPSLLKLLNEVRESCWELGFRTAFNSAVLNLYRNEKHDLPLHADTKAIPQLGKEPTIACVSFGATRAFQLVSKASGKEIRFDVGHGALYIMYGVSQKEYLHGAPPSDKACFPRISVTYRHHQ